MRILITMLLCAMGSSSVFGQGYTPNYGCFVSTGGVCSLQQVVCGTSTVQNALDFGYTVGNLCDRYYAEYNRAESEASRAEQNYQAWLYQANLAKRLKRACGAKCKRIK